MDVGPSIWRDPQLAPNTSRAHCRYEPRIGHSTSGQRLSIKVLVGASAIRRPGRPLAPRAGAGLAACIKPTVWSLVLPHAVQRAFNEFVLAGNGVAAWTHRWEYFNYKTSEADPPRAASMTLDIDSGWAVARPNAELLAPYREMNATGGWDPVLGSLPLSSCAQGCQHQGAGSWSTELGTAAFPPDKEPIVQLGALFGAIRGPRPSADGPGHTRMAWDPSMAWPQLTSQKTV